MTKLWRTFLLLLAALIAATAGAVFVTMQVMPQTTTVVAPSSSPITPQNEPIPARNAAQVDMFKQFRLATPAEAGVLQALPVFTGDVAAGHIYVANTDSIKLVPIDVPMILIMPYGYRWESGPMSMITIVRAPTASLNDLRMNGMVFRDPMCTAFRAGIFEGDCTSASAQPGNWNEMLTHLRTPTEAELRTWQGDKYVAGNAQHYRVATSAFVAAPQYQFDGDSAYTGFVGIFVPAGVHVLGGQLGYMDLYPIGQNLPALDSICFMYGSGSSNRPQTWVPASELQRVARCTR